MIKKIIISIFIFCLVLSGLVLYSRYVATQGLIVKEYKITDQALTDNFHGLKVVHISDLHYGSTFKEDDLIKLVEKIKVIKPDIVVLTGDLFDNRYKLTSKQKQTLIKNLSRIEATIGKYAISGNHDINTDWEEVIKTSDFVNLNDDYTSIYDDGTDYIFLSGISSSLKSDVIPKATKIENYLDTLNDEEKPIYKILLIHEPDYINKFDYSRYDLILAGHSHNGQVRLPFVGAVYTPTGAKKYYNEYYKLNDTDLYISSGLGTSKYDFRFLNRPSFNFYRLTNK